MGRHLVAFVLVFDFRTWGERIKVKSFESYEVICEMVWNKRRRLPSSNILLSTSQFLHTSTFAFQINSRALNNDDEKTTRPSTRRFIPKELPLRLGEEDCHWYWCRTGTLLRLPNVCSPILKSVFRDTVPKRGQGVLCLCLLPSLAEIPVTYGIETRLAGRVYIRSPLPRSADNGATIEGSVKGSVA